MNAKQLLPKLRVALRTLQKPGTPLTGSHACAHCELWRLGIGSDEYRVEGAEDFAGHIFTLDESIACLRASIAALTKK